MSIKAYKFRFYPTDEQKQILAKTFGCVRYVYNRALCHRSSTYKETGKGANYKDTSAELTKWKREDGTIWLKDVSCVPLQQSLRHLNSAFNNFFERRAKYPKFKKRSHRQSAEYTRSAFKWDASNKNLRITKLGRLNVRWSRDFEAFPSTITISKTPSGRYFVSVRINEDNRVEPSASKEIGIDLGIESLGKTSDGETIENKRLTAKYAKKLAKAQIILSRRTVGSNRWHKARVRVAKIQEAIANSRLDWTHKATTKLIRENQAIYVETLKVSNMVKNKKLSKAILDCSWFEFVRQLEYKSAWYGRDFWKINQFAPTSKTCSTCRHRMEEMPLSIRGWQCPECGDQHDRDINAAKNILAVGRTERQNERGESVSRKAVSPAARNSRRSVKHLEVLHS